MNRFQYPLALTSLTILKLCSGADFRNIGFDEADTKAINRPVTGHPEGPADPAKVLPGWTLLLDGELHRVVHVNPPILPPGGDYAVLGDRNADFPTFPFVEGKYALLLWRMWRSGQSTSVWSLEQVGTIPAGTKFLTYRSWVYGMRVQIDDEIIPPLDWQLPSQHGVSNLVYDVSQFAGVEVKLAFVGPFGPLGWPGGSSGMSFIDGITFLTEAPKITAEVQKAAGGKTNEVTLRFAPIAGRKMWVQFKDGLSKEGEWKYLPGGPHNSGTATDRSLAPQRVYRLSIEIPLE